MLFRSASLAIAATAHDGGDYVAKNKCGPLTCFSEVPRSFPPDYSDFRHVLAAAFLHCRSTWVQSLETGATVVRQVSMVFTDSVAFDGWRRSIVPMHHLLAYTQHSLCDYRALFGRPRLFAAIDVPARLLCQREEGTGLITGNDSPIGYASFQIFIKSRVGNSFVIRIRDTDSILILKGKI